MKLFNKIMNSNEKEFDTIYDFLGIIVIPTAAISVSLFTSYFSEEVTISRGIAMLTIFLFLAICAFLIYTNQKKIKSLQNLHFQETQSKIEVIKELKEREVQLEHEIQDHTKGLWREFGPLSEYRRSEELVKFFEQFSQSNSSIISIQLYNHFEQRDSKDTTIKLEHKLGYVMEGKNLNALQQHYFKISTELLKKFEDGVYLFRGKTEDQSDRLIEMYKDIGNELDKLKLEEINLDHVIKFSLLVLIQDMFAEAESFKKEEISIINNDEIEKELFKRLRTGILRGILYDKMLYQFNYINTYLSENDKAERTYLTLKAGIINGKWSIIVITLDNKGRETDIKQVGTDFVQLLIEKGFKK